MKFAFLGSPRFAEIVLEELIVGGFRPSVVICNPDRPVGRKKVVTPPPTKVLALKNEINFWQPEKFDILNFESQVGKIEFAIVAAYAKIIPRSVLDFSKLGTIGVHPSLLPKYRGASPIQAAILGSEKETGVSLYLMDEKLDHGPILAQKRAFMGQNEDYLGLEEQLAKLAGKLLVEVLPRFLKGEIRSQIQDESLATFTKKFETRDAFVDYNDLLDAEAGDLEKARKINRMVRAFVQEPGAWTLRPVRQAHGWPTQDKQVPSKVRRIKLLESEIVESGLKIKKIQVEGEKPKLVESSSS